MSDYRIIPRAEWGAQFRNGFGARRVGSLDKWLHHSVTVAPDLVAPFDDDYAAVRSLERIGQQRFGGGISYNFPITPVGLIFEGVGIDRIGAHTAGHNTTSVGIVLVGNYQSTPPTAQQEAAIAWLLNHGVAQGWWNFNALTGGHRDTKSTACPGDAAYARIPAIDALADGGVLPPAPPAPAPVVPVPPPPATNRFGRALLTIDGSLGPGTTRELQHQTGTTPDGEISRPYSNLVAEVQRRLNARGYRGYNGRALVVDGQGLFPNYAGTTVRTNTQYALQQYLGTRADGVLSGPPTFSDAVRALQARLNAGTMWQ